MDVTDFLTASHASTEAFKTATLLKTLSVNALITGAKGTGKLTLARFILPSATVLDASDFENLLNALESNSEVVLTHIEQCPNIALLLERIRISKIRVVATIASEHIPEVIDDFFSVRIFLPPLKDRAEDVEMLINRFLAEAEQLFGPSEQKTTAAAREPDVSTNAHSLRRQIYFERLLGTVNEKDLMRIMEHYLSAGMGSNNDYRKFLHLYEVPLIRAGLKKFKSQLQLAERLGLNRNTLRKKIAENRPFGLKEE